MVGHAFRNIKFPAIYLPNVPPPSKDDPTKSPDSPNVILDYLGLYLALLPFGRVDVIAMTSLTWKGELVKRLLESWINTTIGVPEKFIRAY
jgi:hypothetical protein